MERIERDLLIQDKSNGILQNRIMAIRTRLAELLSLDNRKECSGVTVDHRLTWYFARGLQLSPDQIQMVFQALLHRLNEAVMDEIEENNNKYNEAASQGNAIYVYLDPIRFFTFEEDVTCLIP